MQFYKTYSIEYKKKYLLSAASLIDILTCAEGRGFNA